MVPGAPAQHTVPNRVEHHDTAVTHDTDVLETTWLQVDRARNPLQRSTRYELQSVQRRRRPMIRRGRRRRFRADYPELAADGIDFESGDVVEARRGGRHEIDDMAQAFVDDFQLAQSGIDDDEPR